MHPSVRFRRLIAFSLPAVIIVSFALAGLSGLRVHASGMTFLIQADWTTFGFKSRHDRVNPYEHVLTTSNVSGLALDWRVSTGDSIYSSPAVAGGVVYVGSNDRKLHAFDASTGAELWNFPTGNFVDSSPTVANGIIYVGSDDGMVYALDAAKGIELWSFLTGSFVDSSPTVVNNSVYIGSGDGKIYALDASTGGWIWV